MAGKDTTLTLSVRFATLGDAIEIGGNPRPQDVTEFAATGHTDLTAAAAACFRAANGLAWCADWRGQPTFFFGIAPVTPYGGYSLFGMGTPATRRALPALTRWGVNEWLPLLFAEPDVRRIEARIPISAQHSINWLTACGMKFECVVHQAGATDEPFAQLAITRNDYVRFRINTTSGSGDAGAKQDDGPNAEGTGTNSVPAVERV